jgi:LysR family transcriptional regulator, low CO2-responsive transcriptional regulator
MYQRWLHAFHAVARSGGFTAASKLLNIGQPTVSMHVSALEAQFGVELFHRRGRRVELTALGRQLLTITEGLFGREEEAIELLRAARARETGSLRIGAVRPLDAMEICAGILDQYPDLRLTVSLVSAPDVLNGLLNFDFDAGVIGNPANDPRFFSSFYKRYRINIIVHVDHPLARRRSVHIKDLKDQRVVQRTGGAFDRALKDVGVTIQPVLETSSLEGVVAAVVQGIGVGALSDSGIAGIVNHPNLKVLPVSDLAMFTEAHVVCLSERRRRPLIASFLQHANAGTSSNARKGQRQTVSAP